MHAGVHRGSKHRSISPAQSTKVTLDVNGDVIKDNESEMRIVMARH
jgi:hypothetical protein